MKPKNPTLYEIWTEEEPAIPELSWRLQLINYVAQFPTEEKALEYKKIIEGNLKALKQSLPKLKK